MKEKINTALYKHMDEILWHHWDPIGVNEHEDARDEYYSYLPEIYKLKILNCDIETLAQHLFKIEVSQMGLSGNVENCRNVASKILKLAV